MPYTWELLLYGKELLLFVKKLLQYRKELSPTYENHLNSKYFNAVQDDLLSRILLSKKKFLMQWNYKVNVILIAIVALIDKWDLIVHFNY